MRIFTKLVNQRFFRMLVKKISEHDKQPRRWKRDCLREALHCSWSPKIGVTLILLTLILSVLEM